jgi:hypothetical protein
MRALYQTSDACAQLGTQGADQRRLVYEMLAASTEGFDRCSTQWSHREQSVDAALARMTADFGMQRTRLGSELSHIA